MLLGPRRRWRTGPVCVAAAIALGACSTQAGPGAAAGDVSPASVDASDAGGSAPRDGGDDADATDVDGGPTSEEFGDGARVLDDPAIADAVFLTAVDEVVAGSTTEGVVDADPGGFLVLATTICDLLDEDVDAGELLDASLEALGATADGGDPDTALLAGGVVGAAVEVYCPRHAAEVADIGGRR